MRTREKTIDLQNCSHAVIARTCTHCKNAYEQAEAQLGSIQNMVETLQDAIDDTAVEGLREEAEQVIHDAALSVEVRGPWHPIGQEPDMISEEFQILLCTGGPAVRIMGKLGSGFDAIVTWLEYQDGGTPWTEYRMTRKQEKTLLTYARCFYFGS